MSILTQRTRILDRFKTRGETYFGPNGSDDMLFRKVEKGPLRPAENYPTLRICDNGQSRVSSGDTDEGEERILSVQMYAMLDDNFERQSVMEDWSDRIEQIIHKYINWMPPDCGAIRTKYVSDKPFDVEFTSGSSAEVWIINFDVHYFIEVEEPEDWPEE